MGTRILSQTRISLSGGTASFFIVAVRVRYLSLQCTELDQQQLKVFLFLIFCHHHDICVTLSSVSNSSGRVGYPARGAEAGQASRAGWLISCYAKSWDYFLGTWFK